MRKWLVLLVVLALVVASVGGCAGDEEEVVIEVIADFTASPTAGLPPLEVQFTDRSTGEISHWFWEFGDGGASTEQNPSHTYATVGEYTVSLEVIGLDVSDTESKVNYIEVGELIADFTASPIIGPYPLEVQFIDNSIGEVTGWEWDFDNNGTVDSTEQSPSHTYEIVGDYTISLTVTGPEGSDTETKASYVAVREPAEPEGTLEIAVGSLGPGGYYCGWLLAAHQRMRYEACMTDYLVYADHDTRELIPGLAERWEISEDGMSCTFWLREGVQFHDDWGELTAEDVKFSLDTAVGDLGKNNGLRRVLEPYLDRIEAAGRYEVTLHFNEAMADQAPKLLSTCTGIGVHITSKQYFDTVGFEEALLKPIFTGPYAFVEETEGEVLVLEAVESHWRVVPEYEFLIFREVPEEMTRKAMLKRGEVNVIEISAYTAASLAEEGFDIARVSEGLNVAFNLYGQFLTDHPYYDASLPWLSKEVREAMNLAIDREEIADYIFHGYAAPCSLPFYMPWGHEFEPYPYDPDRAEQLLEDAGYAEGFDVEMWILTYAGQAPEIAEVTQAVASYWEDIGLNVTTSTYSAYDIWGRVLSGDISGVTCGYANAVYLPLYVVEGYFNSRGTTGQPIYHSLVIDGLLDEMYSTWEIDRMCEEITQVVYDEYATVPLVGGDVLWAKSGEEVGDWVTIRADVYMLNFEYITHPTPLGTFRLFEP